MLSSCVFRTLTRPRPLTVSSIRLRPPTRLFIATPPFRYLPTPPTTPNNTQAKLDAKAEATKIIKNGATQQKDPLAEANVTAAAQRKADWGIIKEMSRYLWPKDSLGIKVRVGLSLGLLVAAKVWISTPGDWWEAQGGHIGSERPSPLLLQNHRRQHER
jgi:hypothetical protein